MQESVAGQHSSENRKRIEQLRYDFTSVIASVGYASAWIGSRFLCDDVKTKTTHQRGAE